MWKMRVRRKITTLYTKKHYVEMRIFSKKVNFSGKSGDLSVFFSENLGAGRFTAEKTPRKQEELLLFAGCFFRQKCLRVVSISEGSVADN